MKGRDTDPLARRHERRQPRAVGHVHRGTGVEQPLCRVLLARMRRHVQARAALRVERVGVRARSQQLLQRVQATASAHRGVQRVRLITSWWWWRRRRMGRNASGGGRCEQHPHAWRASLVERCSQERRLNVQPRSS